MQDTVTTSNEPPSVLNQPVIIPPEIEATLSRLSAYRNVRGVMIISRTSSEGKTGGVVQSTGSVFEGEGGKKYAMVIESLVANVGNAVGEVDEGVS